MRLRQNQDWQMMNVKSLLFLKQIVVIVKYINMTNTSKSQNIFLDKKPLHYNPP